MDGWILYRPRSSYDLIIKSEESREEGEGATLTLLIAQVQFDTKETEGHDGWILYRANSLTLLIAHKI